jgi:hypothetical protein
LQKNKNFSNGLKNPTDNAFSDGFFNPLEKSFFKESTLKNTTRTSLPCQSPRQARAGTKQEKSFVSGF